MASRFSQRSLMAYTSRLRASCPPGTRIASIRRLHQSSARLTNAHEGEREQLNPRSSEYDITGTDDKAASVEKAAFDPSKTSPEEERRTAKQESPKTGDDLGASPANKHMNAAKDPKEEGASASPSESRDAVGGRERTSGRSSAPKNGPGA